MRAFLSISYLRLLWGSDKLQYIRVLFFDQVILGSRWWFLAFEFLQLIYILVTKTFVRVITSAGCITNQFKRVLLLPGLVLGDLKLKGGWTGLGPKVLTVPLLGMSFFFFFIVICYLSWGVLSFNVIASPYLNESLKLRTSSLFKLIPDI